MSERNPTVGGKGKPASVNPPRMRPVVKQLACVCGVVHDLYLTPNTLEILIPCKCGALLRYFPEQNAASIEEVVWP